MRRGKCKGDCGRDDISLNAKGFCSDCQFKLNHDGKSKQEVYSERRRERQKDKPIKYMSFKKKHLRTTKNKPQDDRLKQERLEKRRAQLDLDERTYEEVFSNKPNVCEECGCTLPDEFRDGNGMIIMRGRFSHILSKAAFPEFRNDTRNFNLLCNQHHDQWEFHDRESMRIYDKNQEIIQKLLDERNKS